MNTSDVSLSPNVPPTTKVKEIPETIITPIATPVNTPMKSTPSKSSSFFTSWRTKSTNSTEKQKMTSSQKKSMTDAGLQKLHDRLYGLEAAADSKVKWER